MDRLSDHIPAGLESIDNPRIRALCDTKIMLYAIQMHAKATGNQEVYDFATRGLAEIQVLSDLIWADHWLGMGE